jgi:hypothetical protein
MTASPASFTFIGSCPSLPAWLVNWVTDEDMGMEHVEFDELEAALAGTKQFDDYMQYRLEDIEVHPRDDWAISFLRTKTPTGLPVYVIQDAGIEHVYVEGTFDLAAEKEAAEHRGFEWMDNPAAIKDRLLAWNPPPSPLPVIKRRRYPQLVTGQMGRSAMFLYAGREIDVGPYHPPVPLPWRAVINDTRSTRQDLVTAMTFDGAVCAAKIKIDLQDTNRALIHPDGLHLVSVWEMIFTVAREQQGRGLMPTRSTVAAQLGQYQRERYRAAQVGASLYPEDLAWYDSLPLADRVQLIDDRLEMAACMLGPDPATWPAP